MYDADFQLLPFPMPESTPIPGCPIHSTFMTPSESIQGAVCFRCPNLDCPLLYVYNGASEGYYKLYGEEFRRVFPVARRTIQ
jgi:hypothetical protein